LAFEKKEMGIHSEWVSIMKGEASEAFIPSLTPRNEYNVRGAFIDGQIQLMKADAIRSWDQFFHIQYAAGIQRFFKEGPDDMTVVLGFDNYKHVPSSKAMTQAKRKVNVKPAVFEEKDELPQNMPAQWDCVMSNRVFKTKVILKICSVLPNLVSGSIRSRQRLIIDFMDHPLEYSKFASSTMLASSHGHASGSSSVMVGGGGADGLFMRKLNGFEEIGECDCKFPRWVDHIASMHRGKPVDVIVESTDSDYLMIGMLHYEKHVLASIPSNTMGRVMLHRMAATAKGHSSSSSRSGSNDSHSPAAKKQRTEAATGAGKEAALSAGKGSSNKQKRQYEYVHIPLLYEIMTSISSRMLGGPYPMRSFALLVALAGTDFSRGTPQIGPHRMWEFLPLVVRKTKKLRLCKWNSEKLDGIRMVVDILAVSNQLMANIYSQVWPSHIKEWDGESFVSMFECVRQATKLSSKTREAFPTALQMDTTARNIAWTLMYWMCAAEGSMKECPDPLHDDGMYGYALDAKGKPTWKDVAVVEGRIQKTDVLSKSTHAQHNITAAEDVSGDMSEDIAESIPQGIP
jgi:hypothetical protein